MKIFAVWLMVLVAQFSSAEATNYDLIMAQNLLIMEGDPHFSAQDTDRISHLMDGIQKIAIQLEILDERESRYIMGRSQDFVTDLELLRRRYRELKKAPPLADSNRLPNREHVNALVQFNRAYRIFLEDQRIWNADRADIIGQAITETDYLYRVWDAIRDARCEFYYITVRRHALKKLKDYLGEESYDTLQLPPHVPIWRFRELPRR